MDAVTPAWASNKPAAIHPVKEVLDKMEHGVTSFWLACSLGNWKGVMLLFALGANMTRRKDKVILIIHIIIIFRCQLNSFFLNASPTRAFSF